MKKKVLITTEFLEGKIEQYAHAFTCPKCATIQFCQKTNFCKFCGIGIQFSIKAQEFMKSSTV